jgi:hypothetical protein
MKDYGETTLVLDEPLSADAGDALLARADNAFERGSFQAPAFEAKAKTFARGNTPAPAQPVAVETDEHDGADADEPAADVVDELTSPAAPARREPATFSRGLVDTYFRQMGEAPWLTRDEEIALSKRVEASQRTMLTALCRVPMLVELMARWGDEVAGAQRRLADVIEISTSGAEADAAEAANETTDGHGDAESAEANVSAAAARLQTMMSLTAQMGALSRKRLGAIALWASPA